MQKLLISGLISVLLGCNMKRIDTTEAVNQIKASEVKRITPAQISFFANKWGGEIVKSLNGKPQNNLKVDSLKKAYLVQIDSLELLGELPENISTKEKELIGAYKYNLENNLPILPNLQNLNNGETLLFTSPMVGEKNFLWRLEFTKKEIIKKVNIKELKKVATE